MDNAENWNIGIEEKLEIIITMNIEVKNEKQVYQLMLMDDRQII